MEQAWGYDVSQWRTGRELHTAAKKNNSSFCIARASVRHNDDPSFVSNRMMARELGNLTGSYHFLYWYPDPEQQASVYYNTLVESSAIHDELPPTLDLENDPNDPEHDGVKRWLTEDDVVRFIRAFERLCNRKLMIYTSAYWWNKRIGNVSWAKEHPLWVADWGKVEYPRLPLPWRDVGYQFWQYKVGKIEGYPRSIDQNLYSGTVDKLKEQYPAAV